MTATSRMMGLALLLAAMPVAAQIGNGSGSEMFLQSLKEGKDSEAVNMAKEAGFSFVNYRGLDGDAAIHIVTRRREGPWMSYLMANGANPNSPGKDGDTALIIATRLGFSDGVSRLLARKAEVDKANKRGETALIVAVQQRRPALVRELLEAGANPDKRDFMAGYSAREYAKRDDRMPELIKLIETVKSSKPAVAGPTKG